MNSLMNYFSPTKLEPPPVQATSSASSSKQSNPTPSKVRNGTKPETSQSAKAASRQIVSNMESVINSVNKKHRHRKKKDSDEMNKSEPEITDISNILSSSLKFVSPNVSLENGKLSVPESKENVAEPVARKRGRPRKLKSIESTKSIAKEKKEESNAQESAQPLLNSNINPEKTYLAESVRENTCNKKLNVTTVDHEESEEKSTPKTNAFTLLMNARNRVIGCNQSGQEVDLQDGSASPNPEKIKRKLMLQDWADKKGGAKRKLAEVEREEFIEYQLEKRAKRLKRMLATERNSPKINKNSATKKAAPALNADEAMNNTYLISSSPKNSEKKNAKSKRKSKTLPPQEVATHENSSTPKSDIASSKPRKRGSKRLSSVQPEKGNYDSQDTEFLQNLSSPIKKRDSLLGYFSKVTPPKEDDGSKEKATAAEDAPAKKKSERKSSGKLNKAAKGVDPKIDAIAAVDSPSSRPRRSCAARIRYDEEFYVSPKKEEQSRRKRHKSLDTIETAENDEATISDCEDVVCLDSTDDNIANKRATKLAPLFIKSVPKPAIDPAVLEAKKNFLMSGIPEKMKREIIRQKQFEESFEMSLESMFPKISHVGCDGERGMSASRDADWGKCGVFWREMTNSPDRPGRPKEESSLKPFTPLKGPLGALEKLEDVENKADIVKSLKVTYAKFPTYRCYKQLRAKYKQTKNMAVQEVSDSFVILNTNRSKGDLNDQSANGEVMFTEKYKPMSSDQVLVNFQPVNRLKQFLASWQSGGCSKMNESSNDFDMSCDSLSSGLSNTVVLHGPSSSGKTNAVFALANEMNFNVLEINAGMRRNGKKLLQELQEATQSHLVNGDKSSLIKRSFNGLKTNLADVDDSSSISEASASAQLSLILVEDADIVFEQDSGFVEAIHQLIAASKRPVIIVTNSAGCPHLVRLQKQLRIEFPAPNILNISKFLSVMSLVENCPVEFDDIIRLYLHNRENLRKTILEMQFFIQSGGDRDRRRRKTNHLQSPRKFLSDGNENFVDDDESTYKPTSQDVYTHQTLFDFYTINQNSDYVVQFPVDFDCLYRNLGDIFENFKKPLPKATRKGRKSKKSLSEIEENSAQGLHDISMFYENLSVSSYITPSNVEDRLTENLQESIAHTIIEKSIRSKLKNNLLIDLSPKKELNRSLLVPYLSQNLLRTNRSIDLDYEPMLRSICRSEKTRATVERRGSRFYHYLRNICTNTNNFSTTEFDNTCSILSASIGEQDRRNSEN